MENPPANLLLDLIGSDNEKVYLTQTMIQEILRGLKTGKEFEGKSEF